VTVAVTEAAIPAQTIDPGLADGTTVEVTARLRLVKGGWRLEAPSGAVVTDVLAGAGVTFADHDGAVVTASGPRHHGEPPYVLVTALSRRFDVVVKGRGDGGTVRTERYDGVAIGGDAGGAGLASRTLSGADPSQLIAVRPFLAGDALRLDAGRSRWLLLECAGSRFGGAAIGDAPAFDGGATFATSPDLGATFAGGTCVWPGVFDAGAFSRPGDPATSVFADADTEFLPVEVTADWDRAQPGAFEVNLPADLDARFGARFDHAVFASAPAEPESYPGVVIEPPDADDSLITRVGSHSVLVRAEVVAKLPIGWSAVTLPFRRPQYLRGGRGSRSARLYIEEEGADGFVLIEAILEEVAVGNAVKVAARPAGPARFDVTVAIDGGRFESARAIVAGAEPAPLDRATPEALPGGIVQAKAAGIRARVTRDHTNETNGATHG
jgi:hypothetical protein